MRIAFEPRAVEDAVAIDRWWKVNRSSAPDMFLRELEDVVALVASSPTLGTLADANHDDLPGVRRVLMRRTRYHLYYRLNGDSLEVLAVWHAARGGGPLLG